MSSQLATGSFVLSDGSNGHGSMGDHSSMGVDCLLLRCAALAGIRPLTIGHVSAVGLALAQNIDYLMQR